MSKAKRPVLLIGGVPGRNAEEVFRSVAPILGDLAIGLTDGETGLRRYWINFVLVNTWMKHPDLMLIRPPVPPPGGTGMGREGLCLHPMVWCQAIGPEKVIARRDAWLPLGSGRFL
jgi:hypothetical protein